MPLNGTGVARWQILRQLHPHRCPKADVSKAGLARDRGIVGAQLFSRDVSDPRVVVREKASFAQLVKPPLLYGRHREALLLLERFRHGRATQIDLRDVAPLEVIEHRGQAAILHLVRDCPKVLAILGTCIADVQHTETTLGETRRHDPIVIAGNDQVHDIADHHHVAELAFNRDRRFRYEHLENRDGRFVVAIPLAVLATVIVMRTLPTDSPPILVSRFTIEPPADRPIGATPGTNIAISPDGSLVVYTTSVTASDVGIFLAVRRVHELDTRLIRGTEEGVQPFFSPDGSEIGFVSQGKLKRVAVGGGVAVVILVALGRDGIIRVSPDGGKPAQVVAVGEDELAAAPQLLPDGRTVLFSVFKTREGTLNQRGGGSVVAQTPASPDRMTIGTGSFARYVPSGHLVYSEGATVFVVPFDLQTLQPTGEPVILAQDIRVSTVADAHHFTVSATGILAYIVDNSLAMYDVVRRNVDGTSERMNLVPARYSLPRISPNGRRLAVQIDDGQRASIGVYDLSDRGAVRRLTIGDDSRFPVWSADSEMLTFQSSREGDRGLFWQRADGQRAAERLTKAPEGSGHVPESWSPNGELSLSVVRGTRASLSILRLRDKTMESFGRVESSVLAGSVFSPDGRWLAYHSGESNSETAVFVQPFPATGARHEVAKGNHPMWSGDGTELTYSGGQGAPLFVVNVSTKAGFSVSSPVRSVSKSGLPGLGPQSPRNHDVSPNGTSIVGVTPMERALETPDSIRVVLNWTEQLKPRVPAN